MENDGNCFAPDCDFIHNIEMFELTSNEHTTLWELLLLLLLLAHPYIPPLSSPQGHRSWG